MSRPADQRAPLVLIVDDEPIARRVLAAAMRAAAHVRVQTAASATEAQARAREEPPSFAIVDVWLGSDDASALVGWLDELERPPRRMVVVTAEPDGDGAWAVVAERIDPVHTAGLQVSAALAASEP